MVVMTPDAIELSEQAYALWLGAARRNVHEVARRLSIPRTTVQKWSETRRWQERAATDDRALVDTMTGLAWHDVLMTVPDCGPILRASVLGTGYIDAEGCAHPRPDQEQRRAVQTVYGYLGIVATKRISLQLDAPPPPRIDAATLDALVAAGDRATLRALSRGAPLPAPPPPDFPSDQPGGRGVPGPMHAVSAESGPTITDPEPSEPVIGEAVEAWFRQQE